MRKAYPIGTKVTLISWIQWTISAVAFYDKYESYLIVYVLNDEIKEGWWQERIFSVWDIKKIWFNI